MDRIITIAREYGSGGIEFAALLSKRLGIPYHDRAVIADIAARTSFSEDYVQRVVERKPQPVLPLIASGHGPAIVDGYATMPAASVYQAQREAVIRLADLGPCIIVGRCADYILRDRSPLRVFLYADLESRVRRCLAAMPADALGRSEREVRQTIQRMDRERAKYYNFYTGETWGDLHRYDLCLNTSAADLEPLASAAAALLA